MSDDGLIERQRELLDVLGSYLNRGEFAAEFRERTAVERALRDQLAAAMRELQMYHRTLVNHRTELHAAESGAVVALPTVESLAKILDENARLRAQLAEAVARVRELSVCFPDLSQCKHGSGGMWKRAHDFLASPPAATGRVERLVLLEAEHAAARAYRNAESSACAAYLKFGDMPSVKRELEAWRGALAAVDAEGE